MIESAVARGREQWARVTLVDALQLGICVGAFGLAVTGAKLLSGVPGHSVAFWLPVLFASRWCKPRIGGAAITALSGGLLFSAFPHFGAGKELLSYVAAAAVLEGFALSRSNTPSPALALVYGATCGLAKYASRLSLSLLGLPAKWVLAEVFSEALLLHLLFGLIGGLFGWLVIRGIGRLARTT